MAFTPQPADLTDLATVELALSANGQVFPSGNADENYLQLLISAVSGAIAAYIGHQLFWAIPADWQASTGYPNGRLILPASGNPGAYTFRSTAGGVSAASAPSSFPQIVGQTVPDGSVTWANVGQMVNVSEVLNGLGNASIGLKQFPVVSLGSLEIYGVFQTISSGDNDDGVVLELSGIRQRGMLHFRGVAVWPFGGPSTFIRGHQNIRANYGWGYWTPGQTAAGATRPDGVPDLPIDLKNAATDMAMLHYRQRPRIGDISVGEGPARVTYFMKEMSESTRLVVNRYNDVSPW